MLEIIVITGRADGISILREDYFFDKEPDLSNKLGCTVYFRLSI